jgi:PAS domain S-box-containing protein
MSESIHGERTASEPQDRVTELIEQQTAISEVLRAIASSPHDLQPIFDAILDSAARLCRADVGILRVSEEGGLRRVAVRGAPLLVSQAWSSFPVLAEKGGFLGRLAASGLPTHIPDLTAVEGDHRDDIWTTTAVNVGLRTLLVVPLLIEDEIVGTITLGRKELQPFTDKQISLFRDFAAPATIALESTRRERQYSERLRQIIDTVPGLIWSIGLDGELTEINQGVLDYSGMRFEDHLGYHKFHHPDDLPEALTSFYHAMQTGTFYQALTRLRRADGEYRWHEVRAQPLRDREGQIVQWHGLSIDIHERKRAEQALQEEHERLRQLQSDLAHITA